MKLLSYLSFFLVESVLKINPLVDSVCIIAQSDQMYTAAVIVPDKDNLSKLSKEIGKYGFSVAELCQDNAVKQAFCDRLSKYGISMGLQKFEVPKKVALSLDEWTPESGLVTAAMKLKRKELENYYSSDIKQMYMPNYVEQVNNAFKNCKVSPA